MKISESTFTIEANGFADGPAQPFRDYLLKHKAKKIIFINHPLVKEGPNTHVITVYNQGKKQEKIYHLPNIPPYTYIFDRIIPPQNSLTTAWFGFNNLSAYKGLRQKQHNKATCVYYWAVDFVPERFGSNPLTRLYNNLDKKVCREVDGRIELSSAAANGRIKYLGLNRKKIAPTIIVPMGTWLAKTPKTTPGSISKKRIVFMGHLVERQGVETVLLAAKKIVNQDKTVRFEIIGGGPLLESLKKQAVQMQISEYVTFQGFVKNYQDVESLLAGASIAVAPYKKDSSNFSQFADPGKLKAYLGAGLPIILTDVPPNAKELQDAGAAILINDDPNALALSIQSIISDKQKWLKMRNCALKTAKEYDWEVIFNRALKQLNFYD